MSLFSSSATGAAATVVVAVVVAAVVVVVPDYSKWENQDKAITITTTITTLKGYFHPSASSAITSLIHFQPWNYIMALVFLF